MTMEPQIGLLTRILRESYGPGAWHGADFKAALTGVPEDLAFWRPQPQRHNIAEIAIHHTFYVHSVRGRLVQTQPEPFFLSGEDWFEANAATGPDWAAIQGEVERQHALLAQTIEELESSQAVSPISDRERLDLVLGITCHGVYHAGQIQLIRRLHE